MFTALIIGIIGAIFSGFIAGLLGLGGGAILVPLFFFLLPFLELGEHLKNVAVGTTMACIIFTTLASAYAHYKRRGIDFDILPSWGIVHFVGAFIGAMYAVGISENTVRFLYIVSASIVVLYRLFKPTRVVFSPASVKRGGLVFPLVIGWLSPTIGLGGGFNVQALPLFGVAVKQAVAIASVVGIIVAIPSTAVYIVKGWQYMDTLPPYSLGYVNVGLVAIVAPITMISAMLSARLTYVFSHLQINTIACVVNLILIAYMGWGVLGT